eukprot:g199.t1
MSGSPCDNQTRLGTIFLHHVNFENNFSPGSSCISFFGNSTCFTLHLIDVLLQNNSCSELGCIQLTREAILENMVATSNHGLNQSGAEGSIFVGEEASTNVTSLQVSNNSCRVFSVVSSSLTIVNSAFIGSPSAAVLTEDRQISEGGVIRSENSTLFLNSSTFLQNTAEFGGGLFAESSTVEIQSTRFEGNSANEGGAIHIRDHSNITIRGTTLHGNRALSGGAVILSDSNLNGSSTVFDSNQASNGGGLLMNRMSRINVVNFTFILNRASDHGGAMNLITEDTVIIACQIRNSTFLNNRARFGGALHYERRVLRFDNCTSLNSICSGVAILNTSFLNNEAELAGAAIQTNNITTIRVACSDNYSQEDFLTTMQFLQLPNVDNRQHCATWTGNQVLSARHSLSTVVGSYATRVNISIGMESGHVRFISDNELVLENIRGGDQLPNITLLSVDEFGNGPASLLRGILVANLSSEDGFFPGMIPLPLLNGTGVFSGIAGFVRPGIYHLRISFNSEDVHEIEIEVQVRQCVIDEQRTLDFILCEACDSQSYNFEPNGNEGCRICPDHGNCSGTFIVPETGYWHSSPCSDQIQECLNKAACKSNERRESLLNLSTSFQNCSLASMELHQYRQHQCTNGYSGPLCGACDDSYSRYELFSCGKCLHPVASVIFILLAISWLLFLTGIVCKGSLPYQPRERVNGRGSRGSRSSRRGNLSEVRTEASVPVNYQMVEMMVTGRVPPEVIAEGRYPSPQSSSRSSSDPSEIPRGLAIESFKIIVNFLQVTAVAVTINVVWTDAMSSLLIVANNIGGMTSETVTGSIDCLISWDSVGVQSLLQVFVAIFVPVAICGLLAFFWTFLTIYIREKGEYLTKRIVLSIIVVIYLSYLGLTKLAARVFFCVEIHEFTSPQMESTSALRWGLDTNLMCYESYHIVLEAIGSLILICITLGVPLLSAFCGIHCSRNPSDPRCLWIFDTIGFMYKSYDEKYVYWESIIMARKSLVSILVLSCYPLGGDIQAIVANVILVLALFLHMNCRPYKEVFKQLNLYEAVSLFISSNTIIVGMCFDHGRSSYHTRIFLTVLLFFLNIGFFVFMIFIFSMYSIDYMRAILEAEDFEVNPDTKWFRILMMFVVSKLSWINDRRSTHESAE